jgi:hypothetical protein
VLALDGADVGDRHLAERRVALEGMVRPADLVLRLVNSHQGAPGAMVENVRELERRLTASPYDVREPVASQGFKSVPAQSTVRLGSTFCIHLAMRRVAAPRGTYHRPWNERVLDAPPSPATRLHSERRGILTIWPSAIPTADVDERSSLAGGLKDRVGGPGGLKI